MFLLNSKEISFGQFPNKELNLPLEQFGDIGEYNYLVWHYNNNGDFLKLGLIVDYLKSMNCETILYIGYLPYSRMDRTNQNYSMSLKFVTSFINSLNLKQVIIREPHSKVSLDLINNSEQDSWCIRNIDYAINLFKIESIFYPDAGAMDRYLKGDNYDIPYATGSKSRDFRTGKITGLKISGATKERVLIVDDLCSRGGTFVESAKLLKNEGALNVYLMVAHCEDNVFTGEIFNWIDGIITSKEMLTKDHPRIIKID